MLETLQSLTLERVLTPVYDESPRPDDFVVTINQRRVGRVMSSFADGVFRRWYWSLDAARAPEDRGVATSLDQAKRALAQRLTATAMVGMRPRHAERSFAAGR
ncbi:hypothetical protein [Rhodoplanes sp. SY1]|uniref:hypothetical protein n=1 Tax=Rhodoplanes sp. SY1 TaxID=3166646 RepID=UPI0038B4E709